jgi:predicted GNAT family N-acyltransferase
MAKTRLVKNNKGEYGVYDPYTDQVTPVSGMTLVKNTRGKYGFRSGNEIIPLDEVPTKINLEETFKKKVDTGLSSATSSTDSTSEYKSVGAIQPAEPESPKKKIEAKQAEKQAENQRYIDMFGLGKLDYSGLQKYGSLGEITADILDVPANLSKAFVRGVSNGRVAQAITDYAKDGEAMDSDLIARLVKENAAKTGSSYLKALQEKGVLQTDDLSVAGGIAEIIMESLGGMAGAIKGGFQGAALGAAAGLSTGAAAGLVGGPVGSFIAGSVSAAGGAMSGFAGATSYVNEYGSTIQESLTNKGYDLTDAKQVEKGLKDESVMNEARQKAEARGLTVGMIDALTAGVAGKSAKIAVKIAQNSAIQAGKQITKAGAKRIAGAVALGIESTMGAIGEATGQLAAEGKIKSWDAVALESIAELGPAAPTAAYAMYKSGQINSDLNQENLKKIDALKKTSEALTEDDSASKKAIESKISNLEKENKNRNKSMTAALQVAPVPATKRVLELTDAITDLESTLEAIKEGRRTDIDAESKKALWDSLDDMIAEREEIRQEMLQAAKTEEQNNAIPNGPAKPVVFIGENADKVTPNNANQISTNQPLQVSETGTPITFSEKFSDKESAKPATAFKVTQGENNFGTIIEHEVGGEKQFTLAENGKTYATKEDAKFALQEKLTGQRVSELNRVGIDRVKVEGNLANKEIFIGNKENNNQLDLESKTMIQRAVRALRSVSNANVYLYSNSEDYAKGIANSGGQSEAPSTSANSNAQLVESNGQNSIHINLDKAGITSISHEVFHGALLGLAKKDPNAFITMRDNILNRISDKKSLTVTTENGGKRKVSAKEYLDDFQKRYSGPEYTEADRAEEFLSELAGLMSLEDNDVVRDKSLLESIKLTFKDVLKKFNVEFDSLNELQETEDMVQFFKSFNKSLKTGEVIDLSKVEGVKAAQTSAIEGVTQTSSTQPTTQNQPTTTIPAAKFKETKNGGKVFEPVTVITVKKEESGKLVDEKITANTQVDKNGKTVTTFKSTFPFSSQRTNYDRNAIYYNSEQSTKEYAGETGRNGEGFKSFDDFKSDYGISFEDFLREHKINIKDNEYIHHFSLSEEQIQTHVKGKGPLYYIKGHLGIRKIGSKPNLKNLTADGIYIGSFVPKLKYTDEITGQSTARPEPTTSEAGTKGQPEGTKKKQTANDIISAATDKAIEVKKSEKRAPVGNKKAIKDRFVRLDLINDALDVEPTTAEDLALQYFIRGGKVLRGRTQDAKKNPLTPEKFSLVTLFSKVNRGIYKQDSKEMQLRLQLVEAGAPTMTGIAHLLWESQANQQLNFDAMDLLNAVEGVLSDHISRAGMATALLKSKGTLSQQAILDGDQMLARMSEAEIMETKYYADKAGVTTEEFLKDPLKYITEDEMVDGYNDMQTAFDILDDIQDEEAIKKFLEISAPEDLFLDELVDEAVKPEKTLELQKAELIAEQKVAKAEVASINKALAKMAGEGQTSLVEPTQVKMYATDTLPAMQKKKALETKLEGIKDSIAKIDAAIEFKSRKTIDAFADVLEQKAEEAKPKDKIDLLVDKLKEKYGVTLDLSESKSTDIINLSRIVLPKQDRGKGIGTKVMLDIIRYADENNKRITLTPSKDFGGTSVSRLIDFYKKFGFVENKNRYKDFTIRDSMYREPYSGGTSGILEQETLNYLESLNKEDALRDTEESELYRLNRREFDARNKINSYRDVEEGIAKYNEAKTERDAFAKKMEDRQQAIRDKRDLVDLIYDETSNSEKSNYQYKDLFNVDPLLAALKSTQDVAEFVASKGYFDYQIEMGVSKEDALKDQENSAARYNRDITLLQIAIAEKGLSTKEEPVATEPATVEPSKNDAKIKKLEGEIEVYEFEIENAQEEIENTKYNYKEKVDELKAQKAEIRSQKMSRDEKEDALDDIDAQIEDAADDRDVYLDDYKEQIAEAKREIKKLQKQIDKLKVTTKSQLSGDTILSFKEAAGTIYSLIKNFDSNIDIQKSGYAGMGSMYIKENDSEDEDGLGKVRISDHKKPYEYDSFKNEYTDIIIKDNEISVNDLMGTLADIYNGLDNAKKPKEFNDSENIVKYASKVTTKSQLSGEQISPFKKADPTYKYQMSGTEASLQLIDKIRSKYKMQHTAEEMGMVGKGIRATEKVITDNVITRVFSGAHAAVYKRFANNKANKLIGKPLAMLQDLIANNVRKGLGSQNAAAARASAYSVAMIQNLGSTEDFQWARNKLTGGKSVAKNELWQFGKDLNEMINHDKVALRRVHSLLDPEAFEGVTDPSLPDTKNDLSFAELRLFNTLRDMNDFIHEWHYEHGFLGEGEAADALYEMNKGSYFPRMYNEIENKKFEDLYDALDKLPNSADFTMFKERKDFADVSEKFTLKEDPIYITTKRFGQMMQNQAILQFCDYVAKSGDYKIYSKLDQIPEGAKKAGNYRLLPTGKNGARQYGDLTGKYVPDIVAQQLRGVEFSNQMINLTYQAAKVFDKSFARQILSKAKTTWNPLTRAGNITMNFVFASLMGIDPITLLKNRVAAKESIDAYDADTRELDANGLLGVSMGRDLQDVDEKDAKEALSAAVEKGTGLKMRKPKSEQTVPQEAPKGKGRILSESIIKSVKELDRALTDSYGRADDVAKVAAFKSLVNDYGKSREEAIRIIGSGMQNYNTVGKAYDYASKSVNRFVKFKADSARILYNTFKERPLNLMATLGMLLAAQALASKISGEDEEERKIREKRPYTNKIEIGPLSISLTMKFGNSEINVARYLAPYSMYDAGYDSNTLKDVSTYLPFQYDPNTVVAINDPLIGPLINLARDEDFRGMKISDPDANAFIGKTVTDQEALWNRLAFAGRNYGAPYWGWVENIHAAATGDQDYYKRTRTMSDALLNTVIKVQKVDNATLQRTYEGILRKLDGDVQNISKTISYQENQTGLNIAKKYEQEGVTQEQIDKYVADQERRLVKFTEEQSAEIDKKILDIQNNEQTLIKLQEIQQRKQNKK